MSVKRYGVRWVSSFLTDERELTEVEDGEFVPSYDYDELCKLHNALVEAVHKAMGRVAECDKKQTDEQLIADISYLKRLVQDHAKKAEEAEEKHNALHKAVACLMENIRNVDYLWEGTDSEIFPKVLKFGTGKEELLKARRVVEDLL